MIHHLVSGTGERWWKLGERKKNETQERHWGSLEDCEEIKCSLTVVHEITIIYWVINLLNIIKYTQLNTNLQYIMYNLLTKLTRKLNKWIKKN